MDPAAVMSVTNNKEVTDFSTDIGKKLIKVLTLFPFGLSFSFLQAQDNIENLALTPPM